MRHTTPLTSDFVKAFIEHNKGNPTVTPFTDGLGLELRDVDGDTVGYVWADNTLWLVHGYRRVRIQEVEDFVVAMRGGLGYCPFFGMPAYLELVNRTVIDHYNRQLSVALRPEVYGIEPIRVHNLPHQQLANSLRTCAVTVFHILHQLVRTPTTVNDVMKMNTCRGEGFYVKFPLGEGHVTFDLVQTWGLIEHVRCTIEGNVAVEYLKYRALYLTAAIMFELITAADLSDNILGQVKRTWRQHLVKQAEVAGFSKEVLLGVSDVLDYHLCDMAPANPGSVDPSPGVDFAATVVHGNILPAERITGSDFSSGLAKRFGDADLSIGEVMSKMGIRTVTFDNGVSIGVF